MNEEKIVLYAHAGSGNHGCEALVNTICKLVKRPVRLVTNSVKEDESYSLKGKCEIVAEQNIAASFWIHVLYYGWRMVTGDRESFLRYRFKNILGDNSCKWNLSIGGDNYCYDFMVKDMILSNRMLNHNGGKTILFGCSVEPELLKEEEIRKDMEMYAAIFARESLTYEALLQAGLGNKTYLYPDSAFTLDTKYLPLPEGFQDGNTVGINVSPLIVAKEAVPGMTMKNYKALVEHILETTDMSVALIPHVVWDRSNDRTTINELYEFFKEEKRVVKIEDHSCEELKGYIARCRFFIGARTHATIAAYSSQVPTLVIGYSVKANGIAKDLFGTYENYVVPVQCLEQEEQLIGAFEWMLEREEEYRHKLQLIMPAYIERAESVSKKLQEVMK